MEGTNPLVPTDGEIAIWAIPALGLALAVAALVTILRSRVLTPEMRVMWLLIVLVAPVIGPLLWFWVSRRRRSVQ